MCATVFDSRQCELGEGPLWHPERQQLFWSDILGRRLLGRDGKTALEWQFDQLVSAAAWVDRDTLLVASENSLLRFSVDTGKSEPVLALEADLADTRSNDGRADPFGGFWIGTMSKTAEPGRGAIYRFYRGALERLYQGITIPNAICFAPDGRRAYLTDTPTRQIMVQPLDETGWPDGPMEVFVDLSAEGLNPDGAVVDAEGGLWNAQWGAGRVARYLDDGRFDRAIAVGGAHSSCPAFGGPEFDRMYVTTAREYMLHPDDAQGVLYEIDPGICGRAEPRVILE